MAQNSPAIKYQSHWDQNLVKKYICIYMGKVSKQNINFIIIFLNNNKA